jgi:DNA-binding XRE family transcriptional regulator
MYTRYRLFLTMNAQYVRYMVHSGDQGEKMVQNIRYKVLTNRAMLAMDVRQRRKISQTLLGTTIDVARSAIIRIEKGDPNVGVGTVLQTIGALRASPQHYHDLALDIALARGDVSGHQALLDGLQTYVRVLCVQKRVEVDILSDVTGIAPAAVTAWMDDPAAHLSELALLLVLIYLDAPLADLAELLPHQPQSRRRCAVACRGAQRLQYARAGARTRVADGQP